MAAIDPVSTEDNNKVTRSASGCSWIQFNLNGETAERASLVRMGRMGQQLCADAIMRFVHPLKSPFDN